MSDYVVWRSTLIESVREARRYYEERLAGLHVVKCHGRETTLFFPSDTNHTYTEDPPADRAGISIIRTRLKGGVVEERVFCLDRARLLDKVIRSVELHSYAMKGEGPGNSPRRLVHGPELEDGRYLRVVLRFDQKMWHCLSAYPIAAQKWRDGRGASCLFPP